MKQAPEQEVAAKRPEGEKAPRKGGGRKGPAHKGAAHKGGERKEVQAEVPAKAEAPVSPPSSTPVSTPAERRARRLAQAATQAAAAKPQALAVPQSYNVICVAQAGRLAYESLIFVRSFKAQNPAFAGRLIVAEPQGALWTQPTKLPPEIRARLLAEGAEILPFENRVFGQSYPHGNKIEALTQMPAGPFIFFDTDTVFCGPMSAIAPEFTRPTASMRREGTWPEPPLYGPSYAGIWGALYARFGLEFESTLDLSQPDDYWARYLYFSAGWFTGADAPQFGTRFLAYAREIRDDPPEALACQSLDPWLDQVALPLVIHSFGGGRPDAAMAGLDGAVSCHYRVLSLLYAREPDAAVAALELAADKAERDKALKRLLRDYEPIKKLVYQSKGEKIRAMFDREALPKREQVIRNAIKREGLWLR